jgi:FkbM family methyltransferase
VRVLYLLPDFAVGGGQVILQRTIGGLSGSEWSNVVVSFGGGPLLDSYRASGIRCEVLGGGRPVGRLQALGQLISLIRRERIDVLVSPNTPLDRTMGQLAAAVTGRPVVVWFMSIAIPRIPFPPPPARLMAYLKRWVLFPFNWFSIRRLRVRVASSSAVAQSFADHLGLRTDDFVVVPPGLPDEAFDHTASPDSAEQIRAELGIADAYPVLVNVGMLIPLKGQRELIEMMGLITDRLPDSHLLLVGEGPDAAALEQARAASPARDRVHLLGRRHDIDDLLYVSDGLLSASYSEGFGMSVLEAMASSLPVVAVRTPAFLDFLDDGGSALLVDHQSGEELATAVVEVFGDPGRAEAMGRRGRECAERYRLERRAAELGDVLTVAASSHRTSLRERVGRAVRNRRRTGDVVVSVGPGRGLRLDSDRASADYSDPPERPVQDAMARLLSPGDVVLDIGANVGFYSLLASRLVGPEGRVLAFEPVAENAARIEANAIKNDLANIEIRSVAIGARPGRSQLFIGTHPGGATLSTDDLPHDLRGARDVEVETIDRLVEAGEIPPPALVKIDVEGGEVDVLDGMAATLARHRPLVIAEVDGPDDDCAEAKFAQLSDVLGRSGYTVERLADGYPGVAWSVLHLVARPAEDAAGERGRV